jgi:serine/threonine protein kinase
LTAAIGCTVWPSVAERFERRLKRPVAIKRLHPQVADDLHARNRFAAEARAAAGLSHPNAVAVYDVGEYAGIPYLVMERLPGETLADRLGHGPVDVEWLRRAAGDVLGALVAAHARGIVHRDVKPGNSLITAEGCAKIADFGIAKSVQDDGDSTGPTGVITLTGQLLGTPAYLAPERLTGSPATPRSDLYSLGVVMYEALAGTRPFAGDTPLATAHAIDGGAHKPLGEHRPDIDPVLVPPSSGRWRASRSSVSARQRRWRPRSTWSPRDSR